MRFSAAIVPYMASKLAACRECPDAVADAASQGLHRQ